LTEQAETTFGSDAEGLREAAKSLNDTREAGQPISAPEPEPRPLPDEPAAPREVRANAEDAGRWDQERSPYLQYSDRMLGQLDARQAAETVSEQRKLSEGDQELQRQIDQLAQQPDEAAIQAALEANPELANRLTEAKDQFDAQTERLDEIARGAEAELQRIQAENQARKVENERLRAEKQAAELQRQVAEQTGEVQQYQAAEYQKFFRENPEAERYLLLKDPTAMVDLATHDPMRFRQIIEKAVEVDDKVIGRAARVQAQKQQAGLVAANAAIEQVRQSQPQYQGEAGFQKMRGDLNAAVEAREARGQDRMQIIAELDRAENYRPDIISAFLAEGREFRARSTLASKRHNPVPRVMRPGVGRDPRGGDRSEVEALDKRLSQTNNPKDAAKLLQAMRRAAR
jgi:hypothetical protein